jgi:hypothetical protein
MKAIAAANALRATTTLNHIKGVPALSSTASPLDTADEEDDDDTTARKRPKLTHNGSGDGSSGSAGSCGSSSSKSSKIP